MRDTFCNILIDPLPTTVEVAGRDISINADFRTAILFEQLMQSKEQDNVKGRIAFELFFPSESLKAILSDAQATSDAIDAIVWFYSCSRQTRETVEQRTQYAGRRSNFGIQRRIYDFDVDAPLIYAAFLAQYGVDLQDVDFLHWWKFSAMFSALNDSNLIVKIMGWRSVDIASIKNKTEKQRLARLQAQYALRDTKTIEEKQSLAGALFGGMMK